MIYQQTLQTPIGQIIVGADDTAVFQIDILDDIIVNNPNEHTKQCVQELQEYFEGKRTVFSFPMKLRGTPFQQKIYRALATIGFGQSISYGELAKLAGFPRASRAVGHTMNQNRLVIAIPCHRVLAAHHHLGGFGGGEDLKMWLLNHEGIVFVK